MTDEEIIAAVREQHRLLDVCRVENAAADEHRQKRDEALRRSGAAWASFIELRSKLEAPPAPTLETSAAA